MTKARSRLGLVVAFHGALALAYVGLLARDLASRERLLSTDFAAYATGAALAARGDGAHLYDAATQAATQAAILAPHQFPGGLLAFLNPPHVALAFAPLARLDFATGFRLWTIVQLALVVALASSVARIVSARGGLGRAAALTAVGALWPVFYAVQIGQLSVLLALALARLWIALDEGPAGGRGAGGANPPSRSGAGSRDDARAGAWLFVLSAKPQLLPIFPLLLWSLGRARVLAWTLAFGAAAFALTSAWLGVGVWTRYAHGLVSLESFFAQGTPEHMASLRGLLSIVFGGSRAVAVASAIAFAVVLAASGARWLRRPLRADAPPGLRARRFASACAVALLFCPHLFIQDVTLWIAPLAIFHASLDGDPARARGFARFALAWPVIFFVAATFTGATGRAATPLVLVPLVVAFAWLRRAETRGLA
ncbi:MAG TPA: glycosyltransferase family 87 protein [Polyangia bacterium]|nr:glycosyltransferase family 87 protein [Polyangia bacterium]